MSSDGWRREPRDDFTLSELLNALWARRRLVGGVVLVFVLCSVPFDLLQEPAYVAEATVSSGPKRSAPRGSRKRPLPERP